MKDGILKRYPGLGPDDVVLRDDGDGIYIDVWKSAEPKPTMNQVYQWNEDDETEPKPKTEVEILREENAQLNLAIIDLYEIIMA